MNGTRIILFTFIICAVLAQTVSAGNYILDVGDVLEITVWGTPN